MKKYIALLSILGVLLMMNGCQKEVSFENGQNFSSGSLQAEATGDCLPKNVSGIYEKGTPLDPITNFIDVQVDVSKTGSYTVSSDTVNGMYFRSTGVFTSTGLNTVTLKGNGTPLTEGITNFTITYDTTQCSVVVTTLPEGGAVPAVFSLNGTPTTCLSYTLAGTYITGTALNPSNTVVLNVTVTTIGTYNITTSAANGIKFSGSGALPNTGAQTITLVGSGTPVSAGTTSIPVNTAGSNCTFDVPVVGPGAFTVNCGSAQIFGTYKQGVALGAGNFVKVDVTVATAGAYSITSTVNGMTFTGSGSFPGTGVQNITLQGSGVPQAEETSTVNITAGATPCNFDVIVEAGTGGGGTGSWQFVESGVTYSGTITDVEYDPTSGAPATSLIFTGGNAANDEFDLGMVDVAGGIKAGDTYKTFLPIAAGDNIGLMYFFGADPKTYTSDPTIPTAGTTLLISITSHDAITKNITGTFSGKVITEANVLKDITNGSFSVTYP